MKELAKIEMDGMWVKKRDRRLFVCSSTCIKTETVLREEEEAVYHAHECICICVRVHVSVHLDLNILGFLSSL
jgi:hypothetical protein